MLLSWPKAKNQTRLSTHKRYHHKRACERIAHDFADAEFLAIDTEFMREQTYYSQLCLIQISDGKTAVAIDPLAPNIDLTPL